MEVHERLDLRQLVRAGDRDPPLEICGHTLLRRHPHDVLVVVAGRAEVVVVVDRHHRRAVQERLGDVGGQEGLDMRLDVEQRLFGLLQLALVGGVDVVAELEQGDADHVHVVVGEDDLARVLRRELPQIGPAGGRLGHQVLAVAQADLAVVGRDAPGEALAEVRRDVLDVGDVVEIDRLNQLGVVELLGCRIAGQRHVIGILVLVDLDDLRGISTRSQLADLVDLHAGIRLLERCHLVRPDPLRVVGKRHRARERLGRPGTGGRRRRRATRSTRGGESHRRQTRELCPPPKRGAPCHWHREPLARLIIRCHF